MLSGADYGREFRAISVSYRAHGLLRVLTFLHSFEPGGVERIALRLVHRWRDSGIDAPLFLGRIDGAMAEDVGAGLDFVTPKRRWPGIAHWETLWMVATLPRAVRTIGRTCCLCGQHLCLCRVMLKLVLGRRCPPIIAKISNNLDRADASWFYRVFYRIWLRIRGWRSTISSAWKSRCAPRSCNASACRPPASRSSPTPPCRRCRSWRFVSPPGATERARTPLRHHRAAGATEEPGADAARLREGPRARRHADPVRRGAGAACAGGAGRVAGDCRAGRFPGLRDQPAGLLSGYDTLLLSSHYEGVPAVILEGLAANIGIVATDCSDRWARCSSRARWHAGSGRRRGGFCRGDRGRPARHPGCAAHAAPGAPLHHRARRGPLYSGDAQRPAPAMTKRAPYRRPRRSSANSRCDPLIRRPASVDALGRMWAEVGSTCRIR